MFSTRRRYTKPLLVPARISSLSGLNDMATTAPSSCAWQRSCRFESNVVTVPSPPPMMSPSGQHSSDKTPRRHAAMGAPSFSCFTLTSAKSPLDVPQ